MPVRFFYSIYPVAFDNTHIDTGVNMQLNETCATGGNASLTTSACVNFAARNNLSCCL